MVALLLPEPSRKRSGLAIQEELGKIQPNSQKAAPGKYFILEQPGVTGVIEAGFSIRKKLPSGRRYFKIAFHIARGVLRVLPNRLADQVPRFSDRRFSEPAVILTISSGNSFRNSVRNRQSP